MRPAIAQVWISGNLDGKIEVISAAGFGGVEKFEQGFIVDAAGPAQLSRRIRDAARDIHRRNK